MNDAIRDIDQVRDDLAAIRHAMGADLGFGWGDVYGTFAASVLFISGGLLSVLFDMKPKWVGVVPTMVFVVLWSIVLRVRFRRESGKSPLRRKNYTAALLVAAIMLAILVPVVLLAPKLGLGRTALLAVYGAIVFGVGLGISIAFLTMSPRQLWNLPIGVGAIVAGILFPLWPWDLRLLLFCIPGISMILTAIIEAAMLERAGIPHGAD